MLAVSEHQNRARGVLVAHAAFNRAESVRFWPRPQEETETDGKKNEVAHVPESPI